MEAMPFLIRSAIGLLSEEDERAEEAFWDVVTSMEYSNRNAVNTVCTYVSYQIDLFPNTYSITCGSFLEKVFITFLPLFPQNSPVWLMLTVKKKPEEPTTFSYFQLRCVAVFENCWRKPQLPQAASFQPNA